jgi:hypothetical protein
MRIVMEPIETIALFSGNGKIRPIKFRTTYKDGYDVIKIDRIVVQNEEKLAGNRMMVFRCQSNINGCQRVYEIKYEVSTCKWYLYKI